MTLTEADAVAKEFAEIVLVERFAGTSEQELLARFAAMLPLPSEENDDVRAEAYRALTNHIRARWGQVQYIEHSYWH